MCRIPTLCLALFALSLGSSMPIRTQAQNLPTDNLRIINKTSSLEVINVERSKAFLTLTFRNNYTQPVRGLVVSAQKGSTAIVSFTNRPELLSPGATYTESFGLFSKKVSRDVIVLAAFLEDCTMDGDPETIKTEEAERRGEKIQSEKLLALITKSLDSPDAVESTLNRTERAVSALTEKTSRDQRKEGYGRRVSISTFVLVRIRMLQQAYREDANVDIREGLIRLKDILEAKRTSC